MKQIDFEEATQELKTKGIYEVKNFLAPIEISKIHSELSGVLDLYGENFVKERLFYKREETGNKQGDAVMVSLENSELPHLILKSELKIASVLKIYNEIIGSVQVTKVPKNSRSMMNIQQYFTSEQEITEEEFKELVKNSKGLEEFIFEKLDNGNIRYVQKSRIVENHYDAEFFDFRHEKENGERVCKIVEGLIPRYVMVIVLENNNPGGKGTYITKHDRTEKIFINANAGDMFIFDNMAVRHGVTSLEKNRTMFGFRNFDYNPFYFKENIDNIEDKKGFVELKDKVNPGFIKPIDSEEAKKLMLDFNKKWKEELYDEYSKKDAAF